MRRTHESTVTTASTIEGWEIDTHFGVVASHAVAGTGVVSDFFAGFSDFFGGRSETYRRQLDALYQDTIADLLRQARNKGGNWLIGLRLDIDEVSGKGTQMFMITGIATAVRAVRRQPEDPLARGLSIPFTASSADVSAMRQRLTIERKLRGNHPVLQDEEWLFLIENHVDSACALVLPLFKGHLSVNNHPMGHHAVALFRGADPTIAMDVLYRSLSIEELAPFGLELVLTCGLCSYSRIIEILKNRPQLEVARAALETVRVNQPVYTLESAAEVAALTELIPDAFPDLSTISTRSGVFSKNKECWRCRCGHENDLTDEHCSKCYQDKFGFTLRHFTPADAVKVLGSIGESLDAILLRNTRDREP